ncbi:Hachiman antiphage defense system protein HamA [Pontibacter cellulosilyticus]|uniref:DUF1837 domain-containing protein n=1 Tax=Pontibacter cellulosilyticus TaxID=1720253 RepID=A0A923SKP8_9BACT|nr:Hachiman antiphage defense system protein HamA [Pontibacter cellulosilyticus]MBC5995108.1 DUF1837 domain-containing protein [Pontibacter cellulosilyticus]
MAKSQINLIGNHPSYPHPYERWLACNDVARTSSKCHRSLTALIPSSDQALIDWLANKLVHHHYTDFRLRKLKEMYSTLGFPKYAEQNRKLPKEDKVKKGNATEILLTEYIEACLDKKLIKAFKLKYNPNVDQAIKGDDTLMVDLIKLKEEEYVKLYLGEAKFRKKPSKNVIDVIGLSLGKEKLPISYSFLIDELARDPSTEAMADALDKYFIDEIKGKGNLMYTGFLLSDTDTHDVVEKHLSSDNPDFILISVGVDNPEELINKAFERAEELLSTPLAI